MIVRPTLFVVEPDPATRQTLAGVARLLGVESTDFVDGETYLSSFAPHHAGCVLLTCELPGMQGLEVLRRLNAMVLRPSVIMLSCQPTVRQAVVSMQNGAATYLGKPFEIENLCQEISQALEQDASWRSKAQQMQGAREVIGRLTAKELEVLESLADGLSNKQIASRLGRSVRAVEDRRSRMMKRLETRDLAEALQVYRAAMAS